MRSKTTQFGFRFCRVSGWIFWTSADTSFSASGDAIIIDHPIAGWYGDRKSSHPPYQDHNVSIHGLGQLDITWYNWITDEKTSPWHILDILVLVQSSVNQHESTLASFIPFHSISFQASSQHQKDGRNRNHPSQLGNCLTWAAAWPPLATQPFCSE